MIRIIVTMLLGLVASANAQDIWPSRTITIVCPYAAGTTPDIIARQFADALSQRVGRKSVV